MRISDWSSDVCSSDLGHVRALGRSRRGRGPRLPVPPAWASWAVRALLTRRAPGGSVPSAAMGLLRFSYGTMSSGKCTLALQIHHNLAKQSRHGRLLSLFDREGGRVSSRLGVSATAVEVTPGLDLFDVAADEVRLHGRLDYLVCDEVQFYAVEQVDQLATVADELGADVYAFGLLTAFRGRLFDGSRRMFEVADDRVELHEEARCWCGARVTHNARPVNGALVRPGAAITIGNRRGTDTEN